jgi:D-sedoheptulose 7-phosphate isomerase
MLGTHFSLAKYLQIVSHILAQLPTHLVDDLAETIFSTWSQGGTLFLCGEGPAASTIALIGEHWARNEKQLPAPDPPMRVQVVPVTELYLHADRDRAALVQDSGRKRLEGLAQPGDVLLVFSASDPSPQIQAAVDWANRMGLITWAFTAHQGGRLRKSALHHLSVPLKDAGLVESIQLMLMHWVGDDVVARLSRRGRYAQTDAPALSVKADDQAPLPIH